MICILVSFRDCSSIMLAGPRRKAKSKKLLYWWKLIVSMGDIGKHAHGSSGTRVLRQLRRHATVGCWYSCGIRGLVMVVVGVSAMTDSAKPCSDLSVACSTDGLGGFLHVLCHR